MAGTYPDVPDHRMAWDRDGSVGFIIEPSSAITTMTSAQRAAVNDEDMSSGANTAAVGGLWTAYFGVIFPELRDLGGVLIHGRHNGDYFADTFQTSTNTTNGSDGTWTTQIASPYIVNAGAVGGSIDEYRESITPLSVSGVKAVRYRARKVLGAASGTQTVWGLHLYGQPDSSAVRLRFWHPTLNAEVDGAYFDWGDVALGSTHDRQFRVKNPSATYTAHAAQVSMEALTDTAPSNVSQHTFSTDGTTFGASASLGDLAPGAISGVVTLRRTTSAVATAGLWWTRMIATASHYT